MWLRVRMQRTGNLVNVWKAVSRIDCILKIWKDYRIERLCLSLSAQYNDMASSVGS